MWGRSAAQACGFADHFVCFRSGKTGGEGDDVAGGGADEDAIFERAVARKTADPAGARVAAAATPVTRTPTNSLHLLDSIISIPRTADESVKYLTPSMGYLSDYCAAHLERGLGCALIKSTLGSGNPGGLGIWGGKRQGSNGGQRGQFTSNLGLRWTIPVTTGGCQVSRNRD